MTREEENKMMIEKASGTMKGNFNEGILFLVSSISTTLFDISKSLAIIADRLNAQPIEAPVGSVEPDFNFCPNCGADMRKEGDPD